MAKLIDIFDDIFFEHADTRNAAPLQVSFPVHNESKRIADMHYHVELGIMTKGSSIREFKGFKKRLKPGDIWFAGIFEPHVCIIDRLPSEMVLMVIDPGYLAGLNITDGGSENWLTPFLLAPKNRPVCTSAQRKTILESVKRLKADQSGTGQDRLKRNCLFLLEILLIAGAGDQAVDEREKELSLSFSRLKNAIEKTLTGDEKIDTETAAALCSMSRRNFDRLFSGALGIPFTQFSLRCRLRKAARELIRTDKPLKTIADEFEFTDTSHLTNAFKSFFGCTPRQYRKSPFQI